VIILVILWILGLASSYTMGGLIHILLVLAIVVIVIRVIQGGSHSDECKRPARAVGQGHGQGRAGDWEDLAAGRR
jgi:hypothetical protein